MAGRLIDQDERTRKKPMRILVLGMCRTGTTSLSIALRKLGYTPHQMREILVNPQELTLWQEAINATLLSPRDRPASQQTLRPYGKPEFDKLLAGYDVVMDLPSCIFAKELVEAYSDAKVILTTRDYTEWETSMQESLWCLCTWRLFALARYFNISEMAPLMRLMHSVFRVHNGNTYGGAKSKNAFEKHYDTVRSIVPKGMLLEVNPHEIGWEELCGFLERKVPEGPFPRTKEDKTMRAGLENAWWDVFQYLALMMALPGGVVCLAIVFWVYVDAFREMRDEYVLNPIMGYLHK